MRNSRKQLIIDEINRTLGVAHTSLELNKRLNEAANAGVQDAIKKENN